MERRGIRLYYRVNDTGEIPYLDRIIKAYEGLGALHVREGGMIEVYTTRSNLDDVLMIMRDLEDRVEMCFVKRVDEGRETNTSGREQHG